MYVIVIGKSLCHLCGDRTLLEFQFMYKICACGVVLTSCLLKSYYLVAYLRASRMNGPASSLPCLVSDEYHLFDMMQPGDTMVLWNAKIDMFKGSMRLAVGIWCRVEVFEPATFGVGEDNNLSLIEYELVNVV